MKKLKALGTTLILMFGVAGLAALSRRPTNEYVAPRDAVPKGKAPSMSVELLNPGNVAK
jgi:hypothetical protein